MFSYEQGTFTKQPFWLDELINLFLTRLWSGIAFEIKLQNDFSSTLLNHIGWKSLIVERSGGMLLGMKTSEARCHWFGTVEQ